MVGYLAVTMLSMMGADLGNRYAYGAAPGSAAVVTGVQVAGTVIRQHAAELGRGGVQGGGRGSGDRGGGRRRW